LSPVTGFGSITEASSAYSYFCVLWWRWQLWSDYTGQYGYESDQSRQVVKNV